jgi:hypothetical protein
VLNASGKIGNGGLAAWVVLARNAMTMVLFILDLKIFF